MPSPDGGSPTLQGAETDIDEWRIVSCGWCTCVNIHGRGWTGTLVLGASRSRFVLGTDATNERTTSQPPPDRRNGRALRSLVYVCILSVLPSTDCISAKWAYKEDNPGGSGTTEMYADCFNDDEVAICCNFFSVSVCFGTNDETKRMILSYLPAHFGALDT